MYRCARCCTPALASFLRYRMPFTLSYNGVMKNFNPPAGASEGGIKESVAVSFGLPMGTFAILKGDNGGFFHAGLEGEWELALIPTGQVERSEKWPSPAYYISECAQFLFCFSFICCLISSLITGAVPGPGGRRLAAGGGSQGRRGDATVNCMMHCRVCRFIYTVTFDFGNGSFKMCHLLCAVALILRLLMSLPVLLEPLLRPPPPPPPAKFAAVRHSPCSNA